MSRSWWLLIWVLMSCDQRGQPETNGAPPRPSTTESASPQHGRVSLNTAVGKMHNVALSADGRWLAAWCDNCADDAPWVALFELPHLTVRILRPKQQELDQGKIHTVQFDAAGTRMATTTHNGVQLWSLPAARSLVAWSAPAIGGAIGFGRDHLAASSVFGAARVVESREGDTVVDTKLHEGAASYNGGVRWSPDGASAALLSNGKVHIVRPATPNAPPVRIDDGWNETFNFVWSPDGAWVVHISQQCGMVLRASASSVGRTLAKGEPEPARMGRWPMPLCDVHFTDDALWTFHPDRRVRRWSLRDRGGLPVDTFAVDTLPTTKASSLDAKRHAPIRQTDGRAVMFDTQRQSVVPLGQGTPWWLDARHYAVSGDSHLDLFDNKLHRIGHLSHQDFANRADLWRNGKLSSVVGADGDLHFVRLADGASLHVRAVVEDSRVAVVVVDAVGQFDAEPSIARAHTTTKGGETPPRTAQLAESWLSQ